MNEEFVLKNVSEELVEIYLDDLLEKSDICKCPRCRADVLAIALNSMPTQYVVTDTGDLFVRAQALSNQYMVDVIAAVTKGIMIVGKDPRHGADSFGRNFK